ncbi:MAG TPA: EAL domain-containing protein [Actinomycetes bacterium]|nr:EAL domain-containing protein [Actinomycetes bacterium]
MELRGLGEGNDADAMVRQVLDSGDFAVVFQPVVDLATSEVAGYEALTRFSDGRPPNLWFAEAHQCGLGVDLELAALEKALAALPEQPPGFLSLNISAATLRSSALLRRLAGSLPGAVVLELIGHGPLGDPDTARARIAGLRQLGVQVALDNVGSGPASLRPAVDLQPDLIKIDRSLVSYVDRDPVQRAVVGAFAQLAMSLGWVVVAEGIEREQELAVCADLGIALGQGYLLGRPAPMPGQRQPEHPWVAWTEEIWQAANS